MNSNIIYEFDFDIAINKLGYKNKDTFTIYESKLILLYTLGKKYKKQDIIKFIKKIREGNENIILIKKEELKLLKEMNEKNISNNEYLEALCNYIINNDKYAKTISLELFRNNIYEIMPKIDTIYDNMIKNREKIALKEGDIEEEHSIKKSKDKLRMKGKNEKKSL